MNRRETRQALAAANPVVDTAGKHPLDAADQVLIDSILNEDREIPGRSGSRPRQSGHRLPRLAVGLSAAFVLALASFLLLSNNGGGPNGGPQPAYAAPLVHLAESTPLVLIGESSWHVEGLQPSSSDEGEMQFYSGDSPPPMNLPNPEHLEGGAPLPPSIRQRKAELNWYGPLKVSTQERDEGIPELDTTEKVFRFRVEDRANGAEVRTTAPVLGTTAEVFQYRGGSPGDRDITSLWIEGGRVLEFRSSVPDMATFKRRLASLEKVDTTTWLDAMPASVVKSADQPKAIQEILSGIDLPPGFTAADVPDEGLSTDRYQLDALVVSSISCTWFARWATGRLEGNEAQVKESVDAMAGAKSWPPMQEMSEEGAYPQVVESLAAAMPSGHVWHRRPLKVDVESALLCGRRFGIPIPESQAAHARDVRGRRLSAGGREPCRGDAKRTRLASATAQGGRRKRPALRP